MTFKSIIFTTVLLSNASLMVMLPTIAQNPPAETYQPGFWQPVARVDLQRPVKIDLINQTGLILDYAITETKMEPIQIAPEANVTLNKVDTPIYIVIYPNSSNPNSSTISLKYHVTVNDDNVVKVKIRQISNISGGNRTLNLQETGAIYVY
jgi:hypothetical protein